ncbi:MAG TPA: exodeoxyribonuclease III, partial [Burkholderiales bacterium]|nr:exodeoxyribonuclease III [Burkholderiales bacterium]
MLRIITLNLNGIRSALAKGFPRWLARQRADVVCMQEIKAQEADLADLALVPKGYHGHYHCCSTKKGYSGVALYSRTKPQSVSCGFGSREFDPEGRFLRADFGGLSVVSVYLPSGSSS